MCKIDPELMATNPVVKIGSDEFESTVTCLCIGKITH